METKLIDVELIVLMILYTSSAKSRINNNLPEN